MPLPRRHPLPPDTAAAPQSRPRRSRCRCQQAPEAGLLETPHCMRLSPPPPRLGLPRGAPVRVGGRFLRLPASLRAGVLQIRNSRRCGNACSLFALKLPGFLPSAQRAGPTQPMASRGVPRTVPPRHPAKPFPHATRRNRSPTPPGETVPARHPAKPFPHATRRNRALQPSGARSRQRRWRHEARRPQGSPGYRRGIPGPGLLLSQSRHRACSRPDPQPAGSAGRAPIKGDLCPPPLPAGCRPDPRPRRVAHRVRRRLASLQRGAARRRISPVRGGVTWAD